MNPQSYKHLRRLLLTNLRSDMLALNQQVQQTQHLLQEVDTLQQNIRLRQRHQQLDLNR